MIYMKLAYLRDHRSGWQAWVQAAILMQP